MRKVLRGSKRERESGPYLGTTLLGGRDKIIHVGTTPLGGRGGITMRWIVTLDIIHVINTIESQEYIYIYVRLTKYITRIISHII